MTFHQLRSSSWRVFRPAILAASFALAGCASGPRPERAPPAATSAQNIDTIAEYLNQGDTDTARKLIKSSLKRDPNNATLALLRDSVTRDPVELLGPKSFDYVVQPGDTLAALADRYLGNRLMTYQLARYNGIAKPMQLATGQTLRIPGTAPAPARRITPVPTRSAPAAAPPRAQPTRPQGATPAASARVDPAAARQLRTQGLSALNKGGAAKAVQLLRRAAALDPGNGAIKTDLARAERIAATVRARK
jgi:LysM repeat protein